MGELARLGLASRVPRSGRRVSFPVVGTAWGANLVVVFGAVLAVHGGAGAAPGTTCGLARAKRRDRAHRPGRLPHEWTRTEHQFSRRTREDHLDQVQDLLSDPSAFDVQLARWLASLDKIAPMPSGAPTPGELARRTVAPSLAKARAATKAALTQAETPKGRQETRARQLFGGVRFSRKRDTGMAQGARLARSTLGRYPGTARTGGDLGTPSCRRPVAVVVPVRLAGERVPIPQAMPRSADRGRRSGLAVDR